MCASDAMSSTVTVVEPRSSNSPSATPSSSGTISSERFALICAASDWVVNSASSVALIALRLVAADTVATSR